MGNPSSLFAQLEVKLNRLPETVNSAFDELAPIISGNGKILFFVRGNHPENRGYHLKNNDQSSRTKKEIRRQKRPDQDIWYSEYVNGAWTPAKNLEFPINGEEFGVICGTNHEGTKIYLTHREIDVRRNDTLYYYGPALLEKQADGTWSGLQPIQVEGLSEMEVDPDQSHFYFHLSTDEQHLFLSYHPEGEENEEDLFYAKKQGNGFAKPVALTSLNSKGYETAPFLSKDGRKLYFASNRDDSEEEGERGNNADIYVSERQGDDWTKWSAPKKMDGPYEALNSGKFDAYLVLHNEEDIEDFGFFASNRDARMADIYAFDLIRRYNLEVLVVDGRTNEPLKTTIGQLTKSGNLQNPKTSDGQKFNYAFEGPGALGEYRFVADATNYRDTSITFTLEEYQKKVIVPLFREQDLINVTVPEFTVYYEFDRFDKIYTYPITPNDSLDLLAQGITEAEKKALTQQLSLLKIALEKNPGEKIYLRGHADFIGNTDKNIILSKNRINTVRKFLQRLGIPDDRIREDLVVALGEGESVQDADDVTRASNRKVEIFRAERSGRENQNP
ncbi:MAG: hypothetical protein OHK0053_26940 [Microscillaceae bacterium]